MSDCNNAASTRVTVFAEALVFLHANRRIAGSNVQAAASWYGRDSPPEYRVALLSEVPGGQQLIFVVNQDGSGYYITLDSDPSVLGAIGKPLIEQKFRRCDGALKRGNAAPAAAPQFYTLVELNAGGILLDPKAKSAYYKALGSLVRERWLARLDGPSPQNKQVKVAGADYVLASSCKNHDCAQNNIVLLYSATQAVVYGKVFRRGKFSLDRLTAARGRERDGTALAVGMAAEVIMELTPPSSGPTTVFRCCGPLISNVRGKKIDSGRLDLAMSNTTERRTLRLLVEIPRLEQQPAAQWKPNKAFDRSRPPALLMHRHCCFNARVSMGGPVNSQLGNVKQSA